MIAKFLPVEEIPWGKELKELWTAEARAEACAELRQMIQRREEDLDHYEELFRSGVLSEAAYRDLTARAHREVQQYRAHLENMENSPT